jgi:hypothetical protein
MARGSGLATIQIHLNIIDRELHSWWAAIHHRTNGGTVRLAKGGYGK